MWLYRMKHCLPVFLTSHDVLQSFSALVHIMMRTEVALFNDVFLEW